MQLSWLLTLYKSHFHLPSSQRGEEVCMCESEREAEREMDAGAPALRKRGRRANRDPIDEWSNSNAPTKQEDWTLSSTSRISWRGGTTTSSVTKMPPTQTCWAADTEQEPPPHHSVRLSTVCVWVCVAPPNHEILWAWDFLSTYPPDEISAHLSLSECLRAHFVASRGYWISCQDVPATKPHFL